MAVASLLWMVFMLWGCLNESGASGGLVLRLLPFLADVAYADKLVHGSLHAVLATLLWWSRFLRLRAMHKLGSGRDALKIMVFCACFGALIEGLQWAFTATRSAEWIDALANTTGAGLTVGFWQMAMSCVQSKTKTKA
ncbi:MAG: VanZ family protein [Comamonas sp.]|uniref:VanZ family protein n=1 Tax=Comamonas sp. TaxID=34028 RepID=UPI003032532D